MSEQHKSPCETCPFRRDIKPGYLGGSPVTTYIGQTEAGFAIPCHSCIDYSDPDWNAKVRVPGTVAQCAGAAIFRSNIERPNPLTLVLPADKETVFASHVEFVSHHCELPPHQAEQLLKDYPPEWHVANEYRRAGVSFHKVEKEN